MTISSRWRSVGCNLNENKTIYIARWQVPGGTFYTKWHLSEAEVRDGNARGFISIFIGNLHVSVSAITLQHQEYHSITKRVDTFVHTRYCPWISNGYCTKLELVHTESECYVSLWRKKMATHIMSKPVWLHSIPAFCRFCDFRILVLKDHLGMVLCELFAGALKLVQFDY